MERQSADSYRSWSEEGLLCSAPYTRKICLVSYAQESSLESSVVQQSINYCLDNALHHHCINQVLLSPFGYSFMGSSNIRDGYKTLSSYWRASQIICHLEFSFFLYFPHSIISWSQSLEAGDTNNHPAFRLSLLMQTGSLVFPRMKYGRWKDGGGIINASFHIGETGFNQPWMGWKTL